MASATTVKTLAPRKKSQAKLISFAIFFAVTIFVTYMKNAEIFQPASDIARHFAPGMSYLIPHAVLCGLALILGPFQFSNRFRAKYLRTHRIMGYTYIACVAIGAPMAIPLAAKVDTPSLVAASVVQTFGWMFCIGVALSCVIHGNIQQHRRWMIRGYAFAVVFTVARVIVPIPPILRSGFLGIEIVVWTTIFMAAFLPSLILDWRTIVPEKTASKAMGD